MPNEWFIINATHNLSRGQLPAKPITLVQYGPRPNAHLQPLSTETSQLYNNLHSAIRQKIIKRMQRLDQYISTHKLKVTRPPMNQLVSYLKFERSFPLAYRQQSRVIEMPEAIKGVK